MEGGTVHFYCKQRRFVHTTEQKKIYMSQGIPSICCFFLRQHGIVLHQVDQRLNREIRRRTRVVGSFPDGNSALMLVCARLRHVAGTQWGNKKYMNMKHLEATLEDTSIAG